MALPFTLKRYFKTKEELWKLKTFHHAKIYLNFEKSFKKKSNQNHSRYQI
jgi:hypothetical protein